MGDCLLELVFGEEKERKHLLNGNSNWLKVTDHTILTVNIDDLHGYELQKVPPLGMLVGLIFWILLTAQ